MTHLRHTPAPTAAPRDTLREASTDGDAPNGDAPSGDVPSGDAPNGDVTNGDAPNGDAPDDDRSVRAAAEPMTVRTLRDRRYVVETDGGTYVVSLDDGTCTCPDHAIRGARCKHLRRVAIEVASGSIPAPDERVAVCAVCGGEAFVPRDADGSQLCARHGFESGEVVRDRETGDRLVVVAVTTERADAYRTDEGQTIDAYESNVEYGAHEPVVEVAYVESIRPDRGVDEATRYGFPASRLTRRS